MSDCEHCHYEPESRHRLLITFVLVGLAILVYVLLDDVDELQKKVAKLEPAPLITSKPRGPRPIPGDKDDD